MNPSNNSSQVNKPQIKFLIDTIANDIIPQCYVITYTECHVDYGGTLNKTVHTKLVPFNTPIGTDIYENAGEYFESKRYLFAALHEILNLKDTI